jgi:hypothetical protein
MMKYALLAIALSLPIPAFAQEFHDEWLACRSDDDCVIVYICGDAAINKAYIKQWNDSGIGKSCAASRRPNPAAIAKCVENRCAVFVPPLPAQKDFP